MATNLAGLAEAHRRVAELHPEVKRIRTTVGLIESKPALSASLRRKVRGAALWVQESTALIAFALAARSRNVAIADIRNEMDELAASNPTGEARVVTSLGHASESGFAPVTLNRDGRRVDFVGGRPATAAAAAAEYPVVLLSNATVSDIAALRRSRVPVFAGYRHDTGGWAVVGSRASLLVGRWSSRRNRAFGLYPPTP